VKKVFEVYAKWTNTSARERLDLERMSAALRALPSIAAKSRPTLPKISPEFETPNLSDRQKTL
jgi:hypothetical protein